MRRSARAPRRRSRIAPNSVTVMLIDRAESGSSSASLRGDVALHRVERRSRSSRLLAEVRGAGGTPAASGSPPGCSRRTAPGCGPTNPRRTRGTSGPSTARPGPGRPARRFPQAARHVRHDARQLPLRVRAGDDPQRHSVAPAPGAESQRAADRSGRVRALDYLTCSWPCHHLLPSVVISTVSSPHRRVIAVPPRGCGVPWSVSRVCAPSVRPRRPSGPPVGPPARSPGSAA